MTINNNQIESSPRILDAVGSAPSTGAGKGSFYSKVILGITEAFYIDSQGIEIQITENGALRAPAGTGEANTGINLGSGEGQVFKQKTGVSLAFRTLKQGAGVTLTQSQNEILIEAAVSGGGTSDALVKNVRNGTGVAIPALTALAYQDSGSVEPSDANIDGLSDFAGISVASIASASVGSAYKLGNVPGVLSGLGAVAGAPVYLGEVPGSVSLDAPSGISDTILLLGRAEPTANNVAVVEDLYLFPQIISRP